MVLRSKQMTAKEYLNQIRLLDLKIRQKIEERDHLKAMAAGNSSPVLSKDKVQTSGSGDKMARTVDRYVDLEMQIDKLIDQYVDMRDHIIDQIHAVGEAKYVELLYLKYVGQKGKDERIHYLRLEEIACIMRKSNGLPYTYEHIRSMHGEALKRFAEINSI